MNRGLSWREQPIAATWEECLSPTGLLHRAALLKGSTMMAPSSYGSLPTYVLRSPGAGALSKFVSATAPCIELMTDFCYEDPCVVSPERQIDAALGDMISQGVGALLVVGDNDVLGLVTATDIRGERPPRFLQRADIRTADIMTPMEAMHLLTFMWVTWACAGDLAAVFLEVETTHLLAVEDTGDTRANVVRGIFSRSRLERARPF
jgi:CBS domain-containing protein